MTEQQRIFAEEYVKTGKQKEAAIAAGYKAESASQQASRLLKKDKVLAYVRALRAQAAEGVCLQVEDVLRDLIEIKNRCMQAVPVQVWDSEQKAYVDSDKKFTFNAKGAVDALKLLGESLGMFEKKVKVEAPEVTQKFSDIIKQLRGGGGLDE